MEFSTEELMAMEPREAAAYVKQFVTEASKHWSFYDNGDSLDMTGEGVLQRSHSLLEERVKVATDFYLDNNWGEDDDASTFESQTGIPFDELRNVGGDNTYNWSWLYPTDLNFNKYLLPDGQKVTEVRIHLGGDVRGNYSGGYYKIFDEGSEDDEQEFIYDLCEGSMSVTLKFNDGSSISFGGTQSSDIDYYEVVDTNGYDTGQSGLFDPEEGNDEGGMAFAVSEYFSKLHSHGSGYEGDEFVNEIVED